MWLLIQMYVQSQSPVLPYRHKFFLDDTQLLQTFIVTWTIGLVWCFTFKWPYSIQSLFLRRCLHAEATHVAVYVHVTKIESTYLAKNGIIGTLQRSMNWVMTFMWHTLSFLFSDVDGYHNKGGIFQFCEVKKDSDGSRHFFFLFRRYNYDPSSRVFIPGAIVVGESLGEMAAAGSTTVGLSTSEVTSRRRIVGTNIIEMKKPHLVQVVYQQFSRPLYTYQLFMLMTWVPLYYYHMALCWCFVVLSSGLAVAWCQYRTQRNLYRLTHVEGMVTVRRDGDFQLVDQKDLVPGDVVKLDAGVVYCDMVLVTSAALLVDESALTGESTPQAKAPIHPTDHAIQYDSQYHKRHTIWAGTSVLQAEHSIAVVTKTASYTTRGELLREIFLFQRHRFKFDTEIKIVIFILVMYAAVGFSLVMHFIDDSAVTGWFYGM